jgi:hypothetical protein
MRRRHHHTSERKELSSSGSLTGETSKNLNCHCSRISVGMVCMYVLCGSLTGVTAMLLPKGHPRCFPGQQELLSLSPELGAGAPHAKDPLWLSCLARSVVDCCLPPSHTALSLFSLSLTHHTSTARTTAHPLNYLPREPCSSARPITPALTYLQVALTDPVAVTRSAPTSALLCLIAPIIGSRAHRSTTSSTCTTLTALT